MQGEANGCVRCLSGAGRGSSPERKKARMKAGPDRIVLVKRRNAVRGLADVPVFWLYFLWGFYEYLSIGVNRR